MVLLAKSGVTQGKGRVGSSGWRGCVVGDGIVMVMNGVDDGVVMKK